jgi:hypothetical protein
MATKLDLAKSAALAHETLAVAHADQADQEALQNLSSFYKIISQLPNELRLEVISKLNLTEQMNLYNILSPFKENVLYADVLDALEDSARSYIAKLFNCDTLIGDNALENGTCKPLLTSDIPELTPDQRNTIFKHEGKKWADLLPILDIFNRWFGQNELWKIYFMDVINEIDRSESLWKKGYRNIMKKSLFSSSINTLNIFTLTTDTYKYYLPKPANITQINKSIEHSIYQEQIPHPLDKLLAPEPDTKIKTLKEEIGRVYINLLPAAVQNSLIKRLDQTPEKYIIFISALIDDPYTKKNVASFLEKIKKLKKQPLQVICPRSFIDIATQKERLVDKKKLVLWEQTGGDKEIEWQFPTTTIANWITTQLPPENK